MNSGVGGHLPQGVAPSPESLGTTVAEACHCQQCYLRGLGGFRLLRELKVHRDACQEQVEMERGDR